MGIATVLAILVTLPVEFWLVSLSVFVTLFHVLEECGINSSGETLIEYAEPVTGYSLLIGDGVPLLLINAGLSCYLCAWGVGCGNVFAVSLLVGLRIGDAFASHAMLSLLYRRGNPGIFTAALLVTEAAILSFHFDLVARWLVVGFLFFVVPWSYLLIRHFQKSRRKV